MKTVSAIALGALISLAAAQLSCPTVTREVLPESCGQSCTNANCMYISTMVNPCGCRGVPTATLIHPCGHACPYSGCSVQYFRSYLPCEPGELEDQTPTPTPVETTVVTTPEVDFSTSTPTRRPPVTETPEVDFTGPGPDRPQETTAEEQGPDPTDEVPSPTRQPPNTSDEDETAEPTTTLRTTIRTTPTTTRPRTTPSGGLTETAPCPTITSFVLPETGCPDLDCPTPGCVYQQPFPIPCGCPTGDDIETVFVSSRCPRDCPSGCRTSTISFEEDCIFATTWA